MIPFQFGSIFSFKARMSLWNGRCQMPGDSVIRLASMQLSSKKRKQVHKSTRLPSVGNAKEMHSLMLQNGFPRRTLLSILNTLALTPIQCDSRHTFHFHCNSFVINNFSVLNSFSSKWFCWILNSFPASNKLHIENL